MDSHGPDAGQPSRDEFAHLLVQALREAGVAESVEYDARTFTLRFGGQARAEFHLANVYAEYVSAAPEVRQQLLRTRVEMVESTLQRPAAESFVEVRPALRPMFMSRFAYDQARLRAKVEGKGALSLPHRVVGEHLVFALGHDLVTHTESVTESRLADWGMSFDEALAIACDNLRGDPCDLAAVEDQYYEFAPNFYNGSRLLLTDVIQELPVDGDHVAMAPNRDYLLIAGSDDAEGLACMASRAEVLVRQGQHRTGSAFRLAGNEWTPFVPGPEHPSYAKFRELLVAQLARQYGAQEEPLQRLMAAQGERPYAATLIVARRQSDKELLTFTTWSEGVDTLLPKADNVGFMRGFTHVGGADWDQVVAAVGDLMEPLDVYPERYRVRRFPTDAQLAAMELEK